MTSFKFPKTSRLLKRRDFMLTQRRGNRLWSQRFIYYIKPGATPHSRIGITVSKKVGNAVKRNRIKRWIREVFRTHPHLLKSPVDIVMIAKQGVDGFEFETVRGEYTHVLSTHFSRPQPKRHRSRRRSKGA